jgi:hypothetical protein
MEFLMPKRLLVLFILLLVLLAACTGVEQTLEPAASIPEEQPQPTEVEPTEISEVEAGGDVVPVGMQMECTLVSELPEAPAELVAIFGVTEDDWVKGPETAALTIVEYSDFQ